MHGLPCVFTANKKRGPQPSKRPSATSSRGRRVVVAVAVPRHPSDHSAVSSGPEFELSPASARSLLTVIGFANRMMRVVDKAHLLSSLGLTRRTDALAVVNTTGEAPAGLRACAFMLLCIANTLAGDSAAAEANYSLARMCVDVGVAERPSQHLISALLIMAIMTSPLGRDHSEALSHSALAQRLAAFVPDICPDISLSAACFWSKNSAIHDNSIVWPACRPRIGQVPLERAIEVVSFTMVQFMRGFVDVPPQHVPAFFALLDEATELQATHNLFLKSISMASMCPATKALLSLRDGLVATALKFATSAFDACMPPLAHGRGLSCKYTLAKLLLSLPDLLRAGARFTELDVLTDAMSASALRVLCEPSAGYAVGPLATHFADTKEELLRRLSRAAGEDGGASTDSSPSPRTVVGVELASDTFSSETEAPPPSPLSYTSSPPSTTASLKFVPPLPTSSESDRRAAAVLLTLLALRSTEEDECDADSWTMLLPGADELPSEPSQLYRMLGPSMDAPAEPRSDGSVGLSEDSSQMLVEKFGPMIRMCSTTDLESRAAPV